MQGVSEGAFLKHPEIGFREGTLIDHQERDFISGSPGY